MIFTTRSPPNTQSSSVKSRLLRVRVPRLTAGACCVNRRPTRVLCCVPAIDLRMGVDPTLFMGPVPSDCLCPICSEVLEDPLETQACQHAFCRPCISTWLGDHDSCPLCRHKLNSSGLRPLHRIWREKLHSLQVRCRHHGNGCTKDMQLASLSDHVLSCSFRKVCCPNEDCQASVLQCELDSHLAACPYRSVTCPNCQLELRSHDLRRHGCIPALRMHFDARMTQMRSELGEFIRATQEERLRMESMMEEQRSQIDELQLRLTALISQRRRVKTPRVQHLQVPALPSSRCAPPSPEGYSPLPPLESPTPRQHSRERERHQRERTNTSLPRLAPLHTQMNLVNRSAHSGQCCQQWWASCATVTCAALLPQTVREDGGETKISLNSPLPLHLSLPPFTLLLVYVSGALTKCALLQTSVGGGCRLSRVRSGACDTKQCCCRLTTTSADGDCSRDIDNAVIM